MSLLLIVLLSIAFILHENSIKASEGLEIVNKVEENKITIYLAGDSTVSNYSITSAPRKGWGQVIGEMFNENIIIKNEAVSMRSSKSFIHEGRLREILKNIEKGDYLFIQFGHNDEKKDDPKRYTDPETTYKSYLKQYIDGARKKGAIPVLITPVERRRFSADGMPLDSHGKYPSAMKELAREENVPIIDLAAKSKELYERLGPQKTKMVFMWIDAGINPNYPNGIKDNTHFQQYGAYQIAYLVIEGINELELPLKNYIEKDMILRLK
jgi:lysophospholipase L1-like esterase